ncbi:MAG: SRPBCC family protein [Bacteroidetes bacterium]|jgi:hypothetical protein|nr:SRPBCC family protein [Bacteroidota bacterium]
MPVITLSLTINAPIQKVYDAARNIDLHQGSMSHTNERAVAERTSGLIELGESVTWEAKHFGVMQQLSVQITEMSPPYKFTDEMTRGAFSRFTHQHLFGISKILTSKPHVNIYQKPNSFLNYQLCSLGNRQFSDG